MRFPWLLHRMYGNPHRALPTRGAHPSFSAQSDQTPLQGYEVWLVPPEDLMLPAPTLNKDIRYDTDDSYKQRQKLNLSQGKANVATTNVSTNVKLTMWLTLQFYQTVLIDKYCSIAWASQVAPVVKNPPRNEGNIRDVSSIQVGRIPWQEMATHSSILAWKIPWIEEPGRLGLWVAKSQM